MSNHTLTDDAKIAAQLSSEAYQPSKRKVGDNDVGEFIDIGYDQSDGLRVPYRRIYKSETVRIYEPFPGSSITAPTWIAFKGTDDMFTLLRDIDLMVTPRSHVLDYRFDEAFHAVYNYMTHTNTSRTVKMCGHSLGALCAVTAWHRMVKHVPLVLQRMGPVYGFNSFIQATDDIIEAYSYAHGADQQVADLYSTSLIHHIVESDIASLLLLQSNTTFGTVYVHPNHENQNLLASLADITRDTYLNEIANHKMDNWDFDELQFATEVIPFYDGEQATFVSANRYDFHRFHTEDDDDHLALHGSLVEGSYIVAPQAVLNMEPSNYVYHMRRLNDSTEWSYDSNLKKVSCVYVATNIHTHTENNMRFTLNGNQGMLIQMRGTTIGGDYQYVGVPTDHVVNTANGFPIDAVTQANVSGSDLQRFYWTEQTLFHIDTRREVTFDPLSYWGNGLTEVNVFLQPKYRADTLLSTNAQAPFYLALTPTSDTTPLPCVYGRSQAQSVFSIDLPPGGDHAYSVAPDETILRLTYNATQAAYNLEFTEQVNGVTYNLVGPWYTPLPDAEHITDWATGVVLNPRLYLERSATDDSFYIYGFEVLDTHQTTKWYLRHSGAWNETLTYTKTKTNSEWYIPAVVLNSATAGTPI